jgi:1-acyl-sn-glycerol-3-phosphate acyltransferase
MHRTMFNTPLIATLLRAISLLVLRLSGWKVEGSMPADIDRCVMIAAPHTSNWDLPFTLMIAFALRTPIYWMGKESIFHFPFRRLMMWMGGIPVDRSKSNNMVAASIAALQAAEHLVLIVPPEGTRSKVTRWKTGFYHIAHGAGTPILLGFLDFHRKVGGIGPVFHPSGNIDADMDEIKRFYAPIKGKKTHQFHTD